MANKFQPVSGISAEKLANGAQLASLADETPGGRSIVVLPRKGMDCEVAPLLR